MAKLPVPKKPANILCICFSAFVIIMMNGITKKLLKDMKKKHRPAQKRKEINEIRRKVWDGNREGHPDGVPCFGTDILLHRERRVSLLFRLLTFTTKYYEPMGKMIFL